MSKIDRLSLWARARLFFWARKWAPWRRRTARCAEVNEAIRHLTIRAGVKRRQFEWLGLAEFESAIGEAGSDHDAMVAVREAIEQRLARVARERIVRALDSSLSTRLHSARLRIWHATPGHSDLAWVPYATFLHSWLGVAMPYLLEQDLRAFAIATRHTSRWRVLDDRVVILDRARQLDPSPAWLQEHLPGALDLQFGGNETELVVWGTLAVDPDKIWQPRPKDIIDEANLFLRQLMLERFGTKKFFAAIGARQIAKDATGTLYRIDAHTESLVVVRVTNSTMEPDGSFKEYFLRVPPSMTSAQQAVAWTFGLEEHEYAPVVET